MLACTGTFNNTFYVSGANQLTDMLRLARACDPMWVARVAVYARTSGLMKDAPALLVAHLFSLDDKAAFKAAFPRVINNIGQLRNFVQMVRSGVTDRKSFGTSGRKMIATMLNSMDPGRIFWQAYGTNPSFKDVLSLTHPKPESAAHDALFGYFMGKPYELSELPENIQNFERFKAGDTNEVPAVPFLRLTALNLSVIQWREVARTMSWNQLRININNLTRKGVFADAGTTAYVADKLRNPKAILGGSTLPFAVYNTYLNLDPSVPTSIKNAVAQAVEISARNAPALKGETLVLVDCSGSMSSPVTGYRAGATTSMTFNMAATYFAASLVKANPDHVKVLGFDIQVYEPKFNAMDSVATIAQAIGTSGGATDCGVGLRWALAHGAKWDNIIMISDNESWMNSSRWNRTGLTGRHGWGYRRKGWADNSATTTQAAWTEYKRRRRGAKLFCIDISPSTGTQAANDRDVMNVSGLSDAVFSVVAHVAETGGATSWQDILGQVDLG